MHKIPKKYIDKLELKEVILEIADDLFEDSIDDYKMTKCGSCYDERWKQKYILATYRPTCARPVPDL